MRYALTMAIVALASSAQADVRAKVVVLDARAVGVVDQKQIDGLSTLVASELQARGHKVIAGSDLRAMVGYEKQRQLLGCDDSGCLAEIGGALGADDIVGIEVSRIGATWLLSMTLVETRTGQALERVTERRDSLDLIVEATLQGVKRLEAALPRPAAPPSVATAAPAAALTTPPPLPPQGGSSVARWSLFGVGTAAVIVGAVLEASALGTQSNYQKSLDGPATVRFSDAKGARTSNTMGVTLMAVGAGFDLFSLLALH